MSEIQKYFEHGKALAKRNLDPVLEGVNRRFNMEEEFRVFLDRNEFVRNSSPDVGFLLFLIEQQREAIIDLQMRVEKLEGNKDAMRTPYKELTK
jgi:hypothetical protein